MKDVFSYNVDISRNAYINWRTVKNDDIENLIIIAEGYMMSSLTLAKSALVNNNDKKADIIIFPIIFNANHAIELYLKAIGWQLNRLINNDKKIEGNHDIQQIFNTVKSKVLDYESSKERRKSFKNIMMNLENYIEELYSHIEKENSEKRKDNMDFSRYPINTKYESHFYIEGFDNVVVDLDNFVKRFKEIYKGLNLISNYYLEEYRNKK